MTRLLVAGVAWLAAFGLFAALVVWSARPRPTLTPPASTDLVRALNKMETSLAIRETRAMDGHARHLRSSRDGDRRRGG